MLSTGPLISTTYISHHDADLHLVAGDYARAAKHPIVEDRPFGKHCQRQRIRALSVTHSGTGRLGVTISHPSMHGIVELLLINMNIRYIVEASPIPLNLPVVLKAEWAPKGTKHGPPHGFSWT